MMEYVINIHALNAQIELLAGEYKVDVLGGFGVDLGQFSMIFEHVSSGKRFNTKRTLWQPQWHVLNQRARRILTVELDHSGVYQVQFIKPETLELHTSNRFLFGWVNDTIPSNEISVYIHSD